MYDTNDDRLDRLYFNDIKKYSLLTSEQEIELSKRAKEGDKNAYDELVLANLRLVVRTAYHFSRGNKSLERDLRQVGNAAIMDAAKNYDISMGYRFSTYTKKCIWGKIISYLNDSKYTIRLPQHRKGLVNKVIRISRECDILEMHHAKSIEKIKDELNKRYKKRSGEEYSISDTEEIIKDSALLDPTFLKNAGSDESETHNKGIAIDHIEDEEAENPQATMEKEILGRRVMEFVMDIENKMERDIIIRHFGLHGRDPDELSAIANSYHVTKDRIKQTEARVFRRLKIKMQSLR